MAHKQLALSTMFAQQDRFDDGAAFARFAASAGYDAIEISHSTRREKFEAIIAANALPIVSVHQPAPWVRLPDGRSNTKLNLASPDEPERRAAVEHASESIRWAIRVGAKYSVCHLGAVGDGIEMLPEEYEMRRLFDGGEADSDRFASLREIAMATRRSQAEPFLAAAGRSLRELVALTEPAGITIGVENRYHYHEIPHPAEYAIVLDGLDPAQAGYWHDTGHAEVLHRLGFIDRHAWLGALSGRIVGAHLHDVEGIGDHRSPGDGDVDWGYIVEGIAPLGAYTLEINQWQPEERVRSAIPFLASVGLR
ncbi:MAG: sugar phosphate isomerase/epimerase family protein [Dehalococcoidia bacterium]